MVWKTFFSPSIELVQHLIIAGGKPQTVHEIGITWTVQTLLPLIGVVRFVRIAGQIETLS